MDEHHQMIEDCEARESRLSDWEREFLDSIKKHMETRALTVKQAERLDAIWEKVTARG